MPAIEREPDGLDGWRQALGEHQAAIAALDKALADSQAEVAHLDQQASRVVEAVRAHREHWVSANGDRIDNMLPADRELWIAVFGPDAGGR